MRKASKKRRKPARLERPPTSGNRDCLNAAPRALLEPEDEPRRTPRTLPADASIEDPLRDWPED